MSANELTSIGILLLQDFSAWLNFDGLTCYQRIIFGSSHEDWYKVEQFNFLWNSTTIWGTAPPKVEQLYNKQWRNILVTTIDRHKNYYFK